MTSLEGNPRGIAGEDVQGQQRISNKGLFAWTKLYACELSPLDLDPPGVT
jgi:hypothetical protein